MRNFSDLDTNQFLYHCKNGIIFISKRTSVHLYLTVFWQGSVTISVRHRPPSDAEYRIFRIPYSESCTVGHFTRGRFSRVGRNVWFESEKMRLRSPAEFFFVSYRVLPGSCFRSFRLPFLTHPNHRQMLTCLHTRYIRITYPCTWTSILEFKGSTLAEIKCARESVWWIVEFDNLDQN